LEKVPDVVPKYRMKTVIGDCKAKAGKESHLYPACGEHSLHNETNDNGTRMVNFALGRDSAVTEHDTNIRTFTTTPGHHLKTKYLTR
jgi:hypothetical protein